MKRALIVDDKRENLYLLRALLTADGWAVAEAANGEEALREARAQPPDIVVSDLLMPVMDGFTLLRRWKADPALKAVPMVVYTATYTDPQDEKLALDLGADAFVLKPAEPDAFLALLENVRGRTAAGVAGAAAPAITEEPVILREYSEALVRRLEDKSRSLELANEGLRSREADLAASERRFRGMIEKSSDVVLLLDGDGTMRWRSASGERIFGSTDDAVLGHDFREFVHPEDLPAVEERFARLLDAPGGNFCADFRYRRPDGEWGHAEATASNWLADPDIRAVVGNVREISARKQAEERIKAQLGELQRWHGLTLDRESRVLELKREVNELLQRLGEPIRYPSARA